MQECVSRSFQWQTLPESARSCPVRARGRLYKILMMAVLADGKVDDSERKLLSKYRQGAFAAAHSCVKPQSPCHTCSHVLMAMALCTSSAPNSAFTHCFGAITTIPSEQRAGVFNKPTTAARTPELALIDFTRNGVGSTLEGSNTSCHTQYRYRATLFYTTPVPTCYQP